MNADTLDALRLFRLAHERYQEALRVRIAEVAALTADVKVQS